MLRSRLFLKAFSTIVIGVLAFTTISYLSFVPWVRDTLEQQEERNGRVALDNIYELLRNVHEHLEAWRESALEARRREMRRILEIAEQTIEQLEQEGHDAGLSQAAIEERILESLRALTYGREDYIFIADYDYRLISHPDPELHQADFSEKRGARGNLIVPPMVDGARADGEGFHTYWWSRLGESEPSRKLSYYRHLPDREWVIGTGVYIDDLEAMVEARREAIIERLRSHLHQTRIAQTGYLYVFDSDLNMIIHPDPSLEGTNFRHRENPATGDPIGEDLIAAAEEGGGQLTYQWDRPSDPGNYIYDKIAWVRHIPGLDWYVASSVYISEFRETANVLTLRILSVAGGALLIALIAAYLFLRRLTIPISRLAETASRAGREGDLSARTDIRRNDEIGVLAETFNATMDRLQDQVEHMESRINERTAELSRTVQDLERRNQESEVLNQMGEYLRSCRSEEEVFTVITRSLQELYPDERGLVLRYQEGTLALAGSWGQSAPIQEMASQSCWAVRRSGTHHDPSDCTSSLCPHCCDSGLYSLCIPLLAESSIIGVIKLSLAPGTRDLAQALAQRESIGTTVAKQAALSITNVHLQQRLHQQSIQDPLTGLLNRRYLERSLAQELSRAERRGAQVGVFMLDIDHFKQVNDAYGHKTGDVALCELARLIEGGLRKEDTAYRYGGEEFTLVIPDTDADGTRSLAERIRAEAEQSLHERVLLPEPLTVSIGIALFPDHGRTSAALLQAADRALYIAKNNGRNRFTFATT